MKYCNPLSLATLLAIAAFAPAMFETQQETDQSVQIVAIRSDKMLDAAAMRRKIDLDILCLAVQQWPADNDLRRSNSPPRQIVRRPHYKHKVQQNR